jgi:uncharacterized Zn finger protein
MGYWDWGGYPKTRRRSVKNGIKAKSQRGDIGESWWSKRFVKVLESFNIGARLSRGRSYARSGQVIDLQIKSGLVAAKVQGSRSKPYNVRIEVEPISDQDWRRIEAEMAGQAIFMAKLLAGEMPREIEEAFSATRLSLFPAYQRELKTDCSCPDWSNPCKHIAAAYYILAEKFDEDPFLIFAWRGRAKDQLIEQLRELRGNMPVGAPTAVAPPMPAMPSAEFAPLEAGLENFWQMGGSLAELRVEPQAAQMPDAILRQFGPVSVEIFGKNLRELLTPAYQLITKAAERKALGIAEDAA